MNISITTETFHQDDQSWLGSAHATTATRTITLDTSAFTPATHYPGGYFPSGLPLGKITTTGKYGPYDNTAEDGRDTLTGFLFTAVKAPASTTTDVGAALFEHGRIVEARLPIAIDAAGKTDVAARITFI
ncbi:head decoration protein [Streptosporangium sandarakinum]|uniref:head decoration protein n=1 Tax=Streptosporangium sandarakinum TaxID=1260955 RepID=UPI0036903EE3